MVTLDEKTELRLQEKIVDIAERIQGTSKAFLFLLAATLILALPLGLLARYALFGLLYTPRSLIIYRPPTPSESNILEKKVLPAGPDSYLAFGRISNPNAELAVRTLPYTFRLLDSQGQALVSYEGTTYLLPGQDRLLQMPPRQSSVRPQQVELSFQPFRWSWVGKQKNLNFSFQNVSWSTERNGSLTVSAEVKNSTPYFLPRLEVGVLLYNTRHEVIGVNVTTIEDLTPGEIRFFGLVWPAGIVEPMGSVDFKPTVNVLESTLQIPLPNQPPLPDYRR